MDQNFSSVVLSDLHIGYKTKQGVRMVAGPMSASLQSGCLTCLLGENGVGKSTLLRTMSGFQAPLSGTVDIRLAPHQECKSLAALTSAELARSIGIVLTEKPDVGEMTAMELVEMGRAPYTGFWGRLSAADHDICAEAVRLIGIESLCSRMVRTLSDGERQKVMIAKALAQQTPIIYLDEPTAFLDYPSKVETLLLLRRICREHGKTVFLSTHDLELALQVADTIWLMDREEGLKTGSPHQLAQNGVLSRLIERGNGIVFDLATLSVRVQEPV